VFFYLCLPFLIPILNRIKTRQLISVVLGLLLLAVVGPYCYHQNIFTVNVPKLGIGYTPSVDEFLNQFVRMSFVTRLPEFLTGVIGYRIYREILKDSKTPVLPWLTVLTGIPFLGMMLFEPGDNILNTVLYTGQVIGIPFFLFSILWLIKSQSWVVGVLKHRYWVLMGEASFALYLFHIPIKNAGQLVMSHFLHRDKDNIWFCLILIVVSLVSSVFLFYSVETPSRKVLADWWKRRKAARTQPVA
jgi:peptidoglycan/LPS O-acetylase OafA/YrhL